MRVDSEVNVELWGNDSKVDPVVVGVVAVEEEEEGVLFRLANLRKMFPFPCPCSTQTDEERGGISDQSRDLVDQVGVVKVF